MDTHDRPSPRRRSEAIERLRTVTAGVAVAGIAATAGFGFAAANGYRGASNQGVTTAGAGTGGTTTVPDANQAPQVPQNQRSGSGARSSNGSVGPSRTPQPIGGVQPPSRGSGSSHVSTGGSG